MTEQPDLQYYKICISRNGGPIAFLLKDHTVLFNNKDDTKNIIFIFTAYGKLLTVVNVSTFFSLYLLQLNQKIENLNINQKWVSFNFTDEEDLFIISDDGLIYFIDPKTEEETNQWK